MSSIDHWRSDPVQFIETVLHDPETGKPFKLLPAERDFLAHAFKLDASGRLLYPEQCYAAPKKSGKTAFAALHMLATVLLFGGRFAEGYCIANDLEQAASRVFQAAKRIVEASPLLKREAKITADRILFPAFHGAMISAVACDYTGAAGANPVISCFDELWGFVSENSRRLWDEMTATNAQDRLPADRDLCRFQRRIRPARRAQQARPGAARSRTVPACWRWHPAGLASRSDRAVADRAVACRDAQVSAPQSIPEDDREPFRHVGKFVCRYDEVGRLRRSDLDAGVCRQEPSR
jgi:hypothetical protein